VDFVLALLLKLLTAFQQLSLPKQVNKRAKNLMA
jgi:hypothetical protein